MRLTTGALGESDAKLLLSRVIQIFMPGKPQVWYLDLLAGKNDHAAVEKAGPAGHKEINRTNLTLEQACAELQKNVVRQQLELLRIQKYLPRLSALTQNSKSSIPTRTL